MGKTSIFGILLVTILLLAQAKAEENVRYLDFQETVKKTDKLDIQASPNDPYFKISQIKVTEYSEEETYALMESQASDKLDLASLSTNIGTVITTLEKLIAFGTKVWEIVKKGKPVVSVDMGEPISILPLEDNPVAAFFQMENWSAPKARRYKIEYKNGFGMTVISFDYTVSFQYNGSYEGAGQYVTGLQVTASNVSVSWGFQFNATSELKSIANRGSAASPVASGTVQISYQASSVFSDISSTESFHVTGNGEILKF